MYFQQMEIYISKTIKPTPSRHKHHQDNKSSNARMTRKKGYNFKEYDAMTY